jgi:transposase
VTDGLFLLSERPMARIEAHCPLSHGVPRVDDRRVVRGIVCVIRNGLQWKDAPQSYGPHKMLYNRVIRWSRLGVLDRIVAGLAGEGPKPERIMIDATHLKAHRTAASLATHRKPLRQMRPHRLLSHLHRGSRHGLAATTMSPEPSSPAASSPPC